MRERQQPLHAAALTRRRFNRPAPSPASADQTGGHLRRIVLTGGPGGGQSTAAAFLAREFSQQLWVLPEAATLLYRGGLPRGGQEAGVRIAQRTIFTVQRGIELSHGLQHPDRVLLCDRATIDGAAYWPDGVDSFFEAQHTTLEQELGRYDAVIFLHTAATLPGGYEQDLETRTEQTDLALDLDRRLHEIYSRHPCFLAIPSEESFLAKLQAVADAVQTLLERQPAEQTAVAFSR